MALDLLFDDSIVTEEIKQIFGANFVIRPLAADDCTRGHIKLLSVLTEAPDVGESAYASQFNGMKALSNTYYTLAVFRAGHPQEMLACGSLILEKKFFRNLATCGHIEDIAVSSNAQGTGVGKKLLLALSRLAGQLGCYKIILDCAEKNVGFYEKCGFAKHGVEMAKYVSKTL